MLPAVLGKNWGFIAGMAQNIEFIFAPPAIAFAIGAYLGEFFPGMPVLFSAILSFVLFTAINIYGVKTAAVVELAFTILAVIELLIFAGVTLPEFQFENLQANALPNGWEGAFAAIPFAIWFFLAIEGVANVAEETVNPQRNIVIGFGSAILTLVVLCILTFSSSVGVAGWEAVVYPSPGAEAADNPLPMAIGHVLGSGHILYHLVVGIGLIGLIASFHGIILAAGRSSYQFAKMGYAPGGIGTVHNKFRTPAVALLVNMGIGIIALLTGKTGEIITIACFGALCLYVISMAALFALRKKEPDLERPFKVPFYPLFPATALIIGLVALVAMTVYNPVLALIYFLMLGGSFGVFLLLRGQKSSAD